MHGNVKKVWGWSVWLLGRGVAPESEVHEFSCVKLPVWAVWKNAGAYFVEVVWFLRDSCVILVVN